MKKIKKEVLRFVIAGCCALIVDLGAYYFLKGYVDISLAKGIAFVIGTVVVYLINKFWTFEKKIFSSIELVKFGLLYASTLFLNVKTNQLVLNLLEDQYLFAYVCATGVSTVLNFVGQKWWVFKT